MNAVLNRQDNASRTIYNCPNCGVFVISDVVEQEVEANKSKLAAFLVHRNLSGNSDILMISLENVSKDKGYVHMTVEQIVNEFPESVVKRVNLALENLVNKSEYPGYEIKIESLRAGPIFYLDKINFDSMAFAITALEKKGLIDVNHHGSSSSFFPCGVVVNAEGWEMVARSETEANASDSVFVSITGSADYSKDYTDSVMRACKRSGYDVRTSAELGSDMSIGHRLIATVRDSRFIICDLSDASPHTYFTAGMARALGKTLILSCRSKDKKKLKVDTEQLSVMFWDDSTNLAGVMEAAIRSLIF
jgi:hypothetical protein